MAFPISPTNNYIWEDATGRWKYSTADDAWHPVPKTPREDLSIIPEYSNLTDLVTAPVVFPNSQIFSYGQSLSKGVSPGYTAEITPFQPYDTTTFYRGVHSVSWRSTNGYSALIPLREEYIYIASESATYVETPCSSICNSFHEMLTQTGYDNSAIYPTLHISAPGVGGAVIDEFTKPGANRYPLMLAEVTAYRSLITNDAQHGVIAVSWMQGENDNAAGTTKAAYYADFLQMVSDFATDVRAITSQDDDPHWFVYQLSTHNYYSVDPLIADALLDASDNDHVHMVAPMYIFPYSDDLHLTPEGYYWYGAYVAKAMQAVFQQGKKWKPLRPVSMGKGSSSALITYDVPYGSVSIDTLSRDVTVADYGFEFSDGSGALTISTITPQNTNEIAFTFGRAIVGTLTCKYGWSVDGGNVRDQDYSYIYFRGKRFNLYNWSVIFSLTA